MDNSFVQSIRNFAKGLVTRLDDRESSPESLANVIGFDLARKPGRASKDYGSSKYFNAMPNNCVKALGISSLYLPEYEKEIIVLCGLAGRKTSRVFTMFTHVKAMGGNSLAFGYYDNGTLLWTLAEAPFNIADYLSVGDYIISSGGMAKVESIDNIASVTVDDASGFSIKGESYLYGTRPAIWCRGFVNEGWKSGYQDEWVELTEFYLNCDVTAIANSITFTVPEEYSLLVPDGDDYFNTFIAVDPTNGHMFYVTDTVSNGNGVFTLTTLESTNSTENSMHLFRYIDVYKLNLYNKVSNEEMWFSFDKSKDCLDIGWKIGSEVQTPLSIQLINNNYFYKYEDDKPTISGLKQIYLGRESYNYSSLSDLSAELLKQPNLDPAITGYYIVPSFDTYMTGWEPSSGIDGYSCIDEKDSDDNNPNDQDFILNRADSLEGYNTHCTFGLSFSLVPRNCILSLTVRYASELSWGDADNYIRISLVYDWILIKSKLWNIKGNSGGYHNYTATFGINDFRWVDRPDLPDLIISPNGDRMHIVIDVGIDPTNIYTQFESKISAVWGVKDAVATPRGEARIIIVPMFNGYLLGKPILENFHLPSQKCFPYIQFNFASMERRLTDLLIFVDYAQQSDPHPIDYDAFFYVLHFRLCSADNTVRGDTLTIVTRWKNISNNQIKIQDTGLSDNEPEELDVTNDTKACKLLYNMLGYPLANTIHEVGVNWTVKARADIKSQAVTAVNDGDNILRLSYYDGMSGLHNDHIYPDVNIDNKENPLKFFLTAHGDLLKLIGYMGRFHAVKESSLEVIDVNTARSAVHECDTVAPDGIVLTSLGLLYVGRSGIYVLPLHGGLREKISDAIEDEWLAISNEFKKKAIAVEVKKGRLIMIGVQTAGTLDEGGDYDEVNVYTQYVYSIDMRIWWKRIFYYAPKAYTLLLDNTCLFITRETPYILFYPDPTSFLDVDQGVPYLLETQWLSYSLMQKCLRLFQLSIEANAAKNFIVEIYMDRQTSPFCTMYGATINGTKDIKLPLKVPNSFKEYKIVIKKKSTETHLQANCGMDLLEMTATGEQTFDGKSG